jgi:hypothetical protein
MKPDPRSTESPSPLRQVIKNYASLPEVERAIKGLSDADHVKLMLIARSFCKRRNLSINEMEPEELLSEAILATCNMDKKWNKAVTLVRHLDRAMENISGHLVKDRREEREKIVSFRDGLTPEEHGAGSSAYQPDAQELASQGEEANTLLQAVFGDDDSAKEVFLMRVENAEVSEVLLTLNLTDAQYETISRRIRRRIATYLTQTK